MVTGYIRRLVLEFFTRLHMHIRLANLQIQPMTQNIKLVQTFIYFLAFMIPFHSTEFNLNLPRGKYYITFKSFRSPSIFQLEYRSYEILHRRAVPVLSPALIPLQTLFYNFCLFCNWMLLTHREAMGILRLAMFSGEICMITF